MTGVIANRAVINIIEVQGTRARALVIANRSAFADGMLLGV